MKIEHPITLKKLELLYEKSVKRVEKDRDFYANGKRSWRISTYFARSVAFIGLFIGVAAPFIPNLSVALWSVKLEGGPQVGYVALALSGVILALDQIFVLSQTWIRYRNAELRLNTLLAEFEYKRIRILSSLADDSSAHEHREETIELCEKLVLDARRVVEEETAKWGDQTEAAGTRLGALLKEQSEVVEKLKKEDKKIREATTTQVLSQNSNGVILEFADHKKLVGTVTASLGPNKEERGEPTSRIVFEKVK